MTVANAEPDLAELIRFLAISLVDKPDEVRVELVEERAANVYELEVAETDLGKIIGRGGKTARALRTIVQPSSTLPIPTIAVVACAAAISVSEIASCWRNRPRSSALST